MAMFALVTGCSIPRALFHEGIAKGNRAFIDYWPPPKDNKKIRLAVKDNIDMKGVVTTAGSEYFYKRAIRADKDAPCLAIARQRKDVIIVGKTNLSEFAVSLSGMNDYFGTPCSPLSEWHSILPGGSSCGSAVAVGTGMADVAFGTDTAGSIRVPAACCGVVGLKTTHGLIPVDGVHPIDPKHLDTVGPIAKDIAHTELGMELLQSGFAARYDAAKRAKPTANTIRIGRLRLKDTEPYIEEAVDRALAKAGFQVIPLDDDFLNKWQQAMKDGTTVAAAGCWLSDKDYRFNSGVSTRTKTTLLAGRVLYNTAYDGALSRRHAWQQTLHETFKHVDMIALPTLEVVPPPIPFHLGLGLMEGVVSQKQNTVAVNYAGNPALAVPIPVKHERIPATSMQLIGPPNSEAELLNAGRLVEATVHNEFGNMWDKIGHAGGTLWRDLVYGQW